jgi:hypothetical protein
VRTQRHIAQDDASHSGTHSRPAGSKVQGIKLRGYAPGDTTRDLGRFGQFKMNGSKKESKVATTPHIEYNLSAALKSLKNVDLPDSDCAAVDAMLEQLGTNHEAETQI